MEQSPCPFTSKRTIRGATLKRRTTNEPRRNNQTSLPNIGQLQEDSKPALDARLNHVDDDIPWLPTRINKSYHPFQPMSDSATFLDWSDWTVLNKGLVVNTINFHTRTNVAHSCHTIQRARDLSTIIYFIHVNNKTKKQMITQFRCRRREVIVLCVCV